MASDELALKKVSTKASQSTLSRVISISSAGKELHFDTGIPSL